MFNYEAKLIKNKITYEPVDYRRAKIYCSECGEYMQTDDMYYDGIQSKYICNQCASRFKREVPFYVGEYKFVQDDIDSVVVDYGMQLEYKKCHYTSKGRYVVIKGKRVYLNLQKI